MRWLRQLCSLFFLILIVPIAALQRKTRPGLLARLGWYRKPLPLPPPQAPVIWVHGASAGDMLALLPTCHALLELNPKIQLVATSLTNSGHTIAVQQQDLFAAITYLPWDIAPCVRSALRQIRPTALILEYTELWPELIFQAHQQGVQLFLHNGRFDERRMTSYRWLFRLVDNLLIRFRLLLMRSPEEAERAIRLGAPANRVLSTGNTKFDNLIHTCSPEGIEQLRADLELAPNHLLLVAGSTHAGEERHVLHIFKQLRRTFANLQLLIAPRYIERSATLEQMVHHAHLRCLRRSLCQTQGIRQKAHDVFLLDTIGELPAAYALADVVFVGGSFVARGGQNILEPAAAKKPVLFGPFMHNFADSVQILLGRGGIQVRTWSQLQTVLHSLLAQPQQRVQLGQIAYEQVRSIQGAAWRNATLINQIVHNIHHQPCPNPSSPLPDDAFQAPTSSSWLGHQTPGPPTLHSSPTT